MRKLGFFSLKERTLRVSVVRDLKAAFRYQGAHREHGAKFFLDTHSERTTGKEQVTARKILLGTGNYLDI